MEAVFESLSVLDYFLTRTLLGAGIVVALPILWQCGRRNSLRRESKVSVVRRSNYTTIDRAAKPRKRTLSKNRNDGKLKATSRNKAKNKKEPKKRDKISNKEAKRYEDRDDEDYSGADEQGTTVVKQKKTPNKPSMTSAIRNRFNTLDSVAVFADHPIGRATARVDEPVNRHVENSHTPSCDSETQSEALEYENFAPRDTKLTISAQTPIFDHMYETPTRF